MCFSEQKHIEFEFFDHNVKAFWKIMKHTLVETFSEVETFALAHIN